jgi:hypothetical protein
MRQVILHRQNGIPALLVKLRAKFSGGQEIRAHSTNAKARHLREQMRAAPVASRTGQALEHPSHGLAFRHFDRSRWINRNAGIRSTVRRLTVVAVTVELLGRCAAELYLDCSAQAPKLAGFRSILHIPAAAHALLVVRCGLKGASRLAPAATRKILENNPEESTG